jgi:hypothetical protein
MKSFLEAVPSRTFHEALQFEGHWEGACTLVVCGSCCAVPKAVPFMQYSTVS